MKKCTRCERTLELRFFKVTSCRGKPMTRAWCGKCLAEYYRDYNAKKSRPRAVVSKMPDPEPTSATSPAKKIDTASIEFRLARHIRLFGPATLDEICRELLTRRPTLEKLIGLDCRRHPWFEKEAGKLTLSADGFAEFARREE